MRTVEFPKHAKPWFSSIGASLVSIGMGIGSGEFILWPFLAVHYGYGILWAAALGIGFQVFLNSEIQRYAIVTGKSVVSGFLRMNRRLGFWLLFSTVLGFGWPGFASGSAYLLSATLQVPASWQHVLPYLILGLACAILVIGQNSYQRVERFFKLVVPLSFLFTLGLVVYYFDVQEFGELLRGLLGKGDTYLFIPTGIDWAVLLGAFAYAGSGGNLLLGQGYYVLKKKHGMAVFSGKKVVPSETVQSLHHFRGIRRFVAFENIAVFGVMGLLTILMLSYLGVVLLHGREVGTGFDFLLAEARVLAGDLGPWISSLFLATGAIALFSVQLGVLDILGRMAKEIVGGESGWWYRGIILVHTLVGMMVFAFGLREPLWLLTVGAVCNAFAMAVIAFLVFWINRTHLPVKYRPASVELATLIIVGAIYAGFFLFTLISAVL